MPATSIRAIVDHAAYMKGDVVIAKHQFLTPKGPMTMCSHCDKLFPTTYRRMAKGACEVRNVPQCPACRGRYHAPRTMADVKPGDRVVYVRDPVPYDYPSTDLKKGQVYEVERLSHTQGFVYLKGIDGDRRNDRFDLVSPKKRSPLSWLAAKVA